MGLPQKLAVVTDLHLEGKDIRTIKCLTDKFDAARKMGATAFLICGDLFTVTGDHWNNLKAGATEDQKKAMEVHSVNLVENSVRQLIKAAGGLPIFVIKGNGDHIAYEHMQKVFPVAFHYVRNTSQISLPPTKIVVLGQGGVPALHTKNEAISQNSPWYLGVLPDAEYDQLIANSARPDGTWAWAHAVWMTHMPALGYLDAFRGEHQGSQAVIDFIRRNSPLIHLCGHMHGGSTTKNGDIKIYTPYAVIDNKTLTINPGSNPSGDEVKMVIVDPDLVFQFRIEGTLEQNADKCVTWF